MSPSDWGSWETQGPALKVEGGLKARSSRGAIGESWWSRRFLDVLESFALGTRLTRGRNYARKGQVVSLEISRGSVDAKVQGSRPKPYHVTIGLDPFPELVWAKVEVALAEQALFGAQLLSGEVPPGLDDVFAAAGAPLFPRTLGDLRMRCSCPDYAVPCKHIAATFYLLAEAFDADPFQILRWRGRDKDTLLARLRSLRGGDEPSPSLSKRSSSKPGAKPASKRSPKRPIAPARTTVAVGAALALADMASAPLVESIDRFWNSPVPLPARHVTVDTEPDLLLRQLPPPGREIGGAELVECLRPAYERLGT